MSAPAGGTGFTFFCDDFRPAPRDPLSCELCGHLESQHPVHVSGDVAPVDVAPVDVSPEDWRAEAIARADRILVRIQANAARLDRIDAALRSLKQRGGLA